METNFVAGLIVDGMIVVMLIVSIVAAELLSGR